MENKERIKILNKARNKINEAIDLIEQVTSQTDPDELGTNIYARMTQAGMDSTHNGRQWSTRIEYTITRLEKCNEN